MNQVQKINLLSQIVSTREVYRSKFDKNYHLHPLKILSKSKELLNIDWDAKEVDASEERKIVSGLFNHLIPCSVTGLVKPKMFSSELELLLSCIEYLDENDKDNILFNALSKNQK